MKVLAQIEAGIRYTDSTFTCCMMMRDEGRISLRKIARHRSNDLGSPQLKTMTSWQCKVYLCAQTYLPVVLVVELTNELLCDSAVHRD